MIVIGHRGAAGLAPENTIPSLKKGLAHHADELEIDVRVTKDGVVVCHHDPHVMDASGVSTRISSHTYAELHDYAPNLIRLDEALHAINGAVPVILDVKKDVQVSSIITTIKIYLQSGGQPASLRLASFSQSLLRQLHIAFPTIDIIVNERWSAVRAQLRARQLGTRYITMNGRWLWSGVIQALSRDGYRLCAYTLNDPKQVRKWSAYGLYGVITDYPDRFQS